MLYPKIKKKKQRIKTYILDILDDIKIMTYKTIKMIISIDYFILFVQKRFHL